ncbi:MAG: N-6 DNA methylase [Chloroflexi bacterium]|nr:N-6 DNA methylase [Chloroflexota bacterium]
MRVIMTPQEFVKKWANSELGEKQIAQAHFLDVCKLVGVEMPGGDGRTDAGEIFVFEQSLKKAASHGFADVYYEGHFAIEYKSPDKYKDLNAAYQQLLQYRENLNNPPLLVVTDINHWEIHTNFPNTQKRVYDFRHDEIADDPEKQAWLRALFHAPERLHPRRNTEQVTKEAAQVFRLIADNMRDWEADSKRIAYFLTKLVFCLFAEDIGLLPTAVNSPQGIFTHIIEQSRSKPGVFMQYVRNLFVAMNEGGNILMRDIPYFNGTLFKVVTVEELSVEALVELEKAAKLNWEAIEPSIFGTLFERSLDPDKRAQLGAHYTSRDDILLIVEPVLMQPLRYEWDTVQLQAAQVRERYDSAKTGRARSNARNQLLDLRERILKCIRGTTVLDPACGSGNFLYVSLQLLMDLEKEVIQHSLWAGLQMPTPEVHPRQMYGIEIDPIAHALASIVVWIGYIQWRQNNGYGQSFKEPILEELEDNIVCKDAILAYDDAGNPTQPDWPAVDVIVGNPPFLGGSKLRGELGDEYYESLTDHYAGRVPGFADLVCYWFEMAREQIENGKAKRAGLLATNSIRGGANREVLKRIKESGDIFMAWSDRPWILDGAAVRVSMVGFDLGTETERVLDGMPAHHITPDLMANVDITIAKMLEENELMSFQGPSPKGSFDIDSENALGMLKEENISGRSNSDVVKPVINAADIVRIPRDYWTIDFGPYMPEYEAQLYELPFKHVLHNVYPVRKYNNREAYRRKWWIYAEARVAMREKINEIDRYIATPRVAKHRVFVWVNSCVMSNDAIIAIARDDDYFFGVLHSKLHETWSLRMGTWLGKGNDPRYTPTTTFETFPFPWSPGREDASHPAHATISRAAAQLHEKRHAWLNPAGMSEKQLKDRTLTNLYNALQVHRKRDDIKVKPDARKFAPRLDELHRALDEAVCDAYGWDYAVLDDEEEILRRLLALNLARAG